MLNPQPLIRCSAVSTIRSRKRGSNGASNGWTSFVRRVKPRPSSRATMYRPGSTHRSCPVSKTRIFSSRSSNFILPLLDDKPIRFVDPYVEQFVKAFFPAGEFHSRRRSEDAAHRNPLLGGTLLVAARAVLDSRLEVIADHPEACAPGGFDVHLPLHARGVRVVHDERLAGLDTRLQE